MLKASPTTWQKVKLGDVLKLEYGFALPERLRHKGSFPVFGSSGIVGYHEHPMIPPRSIIVGRKGNVGSVFYSTGACCPIDTVYYVDPRQTKQDMRFLYYLLKTIPFVKVGSDTGVPGLNRDVAHQLEVNIPDDTSTQSRIASILSAFDDKIELNNKINATLEAMSQEIFKEWFVKFRFPGHEKVKFVDSEMGKIPEGWEVATLFDIAEITYGFPFKSQLFNERGEGKPLIRIRNLNDGQTRTFTTEIVDSKYIINAGDVLVGMDGDFYVRKWFQEGALLNQRVAKIKPREGYSWNFIYWMLNSEIKKKQLEVGGSTVAHLGDKDLQRIELVKPSEEVMQKYLALDNAYYYGVKLAIEKILLSKTRDLLLPKLMSGEMVS